jgi:hypothetical protein
MSSGQQSIDASFEASFCMLLWASPVGIDKTSADAPSGSITREAAIANVSMVRTSRIGFYLPTLSRRLESLILVKHL